jgi:hypothetical protein
MALTCVVCRGEDFDETEEGFYVCHLCGTQSQDVVREVEDEELQFNTAGAGITRGARRVRTPSHRGDARGTARGADFQDGTYGATPAGPGSRVAKRQRVSAYADASEDTSPESRDALERVVAYCDGVQRLLRAQCDALVQTMGFPEAIRAETRAVWLAYLDGSRILETDFADPDAFLENAAAADAKTEPRASVREGSEGSDASDTATTSTSDSEDDTSAGSAASSDDGTDDEGRPRKAARPSSRKEKSEKKKALTTKKKEKRVTFRAFVTRRFPIRCTLASVYLACLRLRLPVHCGDLTAWAADGRLPFLAESARVADGVAASEPEPPSSRSVDVAAQTVAARFAAPLAPALVARSVPRTHLVAAFAARMVRVAESAELKEAQRGRVAFPPTNAAAFVERFGGALGLGGAFAEQAMRALCLYQAPGLRHARASRAGAALPSDPNEARGRSRTQTRGVPAPPHAHAAATVVAAMKVAYDLSAPDVSASDEASYARWRVDVTARAETRRAVTSTSASTGTGFSYPVKRKENASSTTRHDAFLAFCRDHVFGGRGSVPPPRDRVVANLWRAYETREKHADVSEGSEEATEETAPIAPFRAKTFSLKKTRRANDGGVVGAGRDAYWRGPAVLADAPRAYRAAVETVAELACVAPETLHACVLDVDAALEARERGLRREAKAREQAQEQAREQAREQAGEQAREKAREKARKRVERDGDWTQKAKPGRERRRDETMPETR